MNKYNPNKEVLILKQKICNITAVILELYSKKLISKEVKDKLLSEVQK